MKKRILSLLLMLTCVLPLLLTGCSDEEVDAVVVRPPLTLTLYGITGETTTEEAILAVEEALNVYTEGKFNTHIVLKLFPEDQYYAELDKKLADIERIKKEEEEAEKKRKEEDKALAAMGQTRPPEPTTEETELETYIENGMVKPVYPDVKDTQLDIFMVQGHANLIKYLDGGYLSPLSETLSDTAKLLSKYISSDLLSMATVEEELYGIPNNNLAGAYTYLLVNKELATRYYYAESDLDDLDGLANFLDDAATNHPDYITLYNAPYIELDYLTERPSLIGGIVSNDSTAFTRMLPRDMLNISAYTKHLTALHEYNKKNYITEGDYFKLPEEKFAAAFLRGDAGIPAQYEEDYFVIEYVKPAAHAEDVPGTMFCVSSFAEDNVARCMEIITALQTESSFRNTFQYGVQGVHYHVDEFTGIVDVISDAYAMDPADTGNLFLLKPNSSMSETMLRMAADNWKLGKVQYQDTVVSPYALFDFKLITEENYKTDSPVYAELYEKALAKAKADAKKEGIEFDETTFEYNEPYPHIFMDVALEELQKLSDHYMELIENFEEYEDEEGNIVTFSDYLRIVRKEFEADEYYKAFTDTKNDDSANRQYSNWWTENDPGKTDGPGAPPPPPMA